jgi:transposase
MANLLKMAQVHAIEALRARGWSYRRIGRELGVHRETVRRYALRASRGDPAGASAVENRPNPPTGCDDQNRPNPPAGSSGPVSRCEPWREQIVAGLERGLSAQRIWQDLCQEAGFTDAYDSVKRYCRRLGSSSPLPYRRMSCEPGAEAQVDFGTGAPVVDASGAGGGKKRRTHVFRIVLSHSRKAYSEAVYRQTTEEFIRCLENAFHHFGGVSGTLVLDNLKAAVTKADWFDPELNPKMQSFCAHYGIVPLPTKPRMPRHKGKVERGIAYVQDNALKGHVFASLQEQNAHLLQWETTVADTRIHGTTKRQVKHVFDEIERSTLQPLAEERFPSFEEGSRMVNVSGRPNRFSRTFGEAVGVE